MKPNYHNQITAQGINIQSIKLIDCLKYHVFGGAQMDGKILKQSFRVLEKVEAEQFDEHENEAEKQQLNRRLEKIEATLSAIMNLSSEKQT